MNGKVERDEGGVGSSEKPRRGVLKRQAYLFAVFLLGAFGFHLFKNYESEVRCGTEAGVVRVIQGSIPDWNLWPDEVRRFSIDSFAGDQNRENAQNNYNKYGYIVKRSQSSCERLTGSFIWRLSKWGIINGDPLFFDRPADFRLLQSSLGIVRPRPLASYFSNPPLLFLYIIVALVTLVWDVRSQSKTRDPNATHQ